MRKFRLKLKLYYVCCFISVSFLVFLVYATFKTQSLPTTFISPVKYSFRPNYDPTLTSVRSRDVPYHVMFLFDEARKNQQLQNNFKRCLSSLLLKLSKSLIIHITGDKDSFHLAENIFDSLNHDGKVQVIHHDKTDILPNILLIIAKIHFQLSAKAHHFSDPIFYLSLVIHRIMPVNITRLVLLDVDLIFRSDIVNLFSIFDNFNDGQVIGIARENQPVYRNVFWEYRKKHPGTKVGEPPPNGFTGFNSGVLLFDLVKLRHSVLYNSFLVQDNLISLVTKYEFQGHLGDQDFFTLLSFENKELFYVLPCGWNRQLCKWWRRDDFIPIFHKYYSCDEPVHILHGNCNTTFHP